VISARQSAFFFNGLLVVHKDCKQDNDRKRNAQ
jgi:hypothetical protein